MNNRQTKKGIAPVIAFGLITCVLYGLGAGVRSDIGILLNPLAEHSGIGYEDVSTCIAVMQLIFGASQPVFGIVASKRSNRFVLLAGLAFMGIGMLGMMTATSFLVLMLSLGILFGLGAGAVSFGLVLSSAIRFVGQEHAMMISGMLNAAAGMVGFVLSPLTQTLLSRYGLGVTFTVLILIVAALVPVALVVTSRDAASVQEEKKTGTEQSGVRQLFSEAFHNRTYRLLLAGFSTCGFHMVIIESHLFSQFVLFGIPEKMASWAFSVYGIATIAGALLSGFLSTKMPKGRLLGLYYGFRAVWVLSYLFLFPRSMAGAVVFSIGLGLTGDATVSPTSGLVSENFSISKVATLVGTLFFGHQIGAFLSAWLGGIIRESTGGYTALWILDAAVCAFACVMSNLIRNPKKSKKSQTEHA